MPPLQLPSRPASSISPPSTSLAAIALAAAPAVRTLVASPRGRRFLYASLLAAATLVAWRNERLWSASLGVARSSSSPRGATAPASAAGGANDGGDNEEAPILASEWLEKCRAQQKAEMEELRRSREKDAPSDPPSIRKTEAADNDGSNDNDAPASVPEHGTAVICAIAVDEEPYLDEWADYALSVPKFSRIYLCDNSDAHDLRQWGDERAEKGDAISVFHFPGDRRQGPAYGLRAAGDGGGARVRLLHGRGRVFGAGAASGRRVLRGAYQTS